MEHGLPAPTAEPHADTGLRVPLRGYLSVICCSSKRCFGYKCWEAATGHISSTAGGINGLCTLHSHRFHPGARGSLVSDTAPEGSAADSPEKPTKHQWDVYLGRYRGNAHTEICQNPQQQAMPLALAEEGTHAARCILGPHVLQKGQSNLIVHRKQVMCTEKSSCSLNPPISKITF